MVDMALLIHGILSVYISLNTSTTNKISDCLTEAMDVTDLTVDTDVIGAFVDDPTLEDIPTLVIKAGVTGNAFQT